MIVYYGVLSVIEAFKMSIDNFDLQDKNIVEKALKQEIKSRCGKISPELHALYEIIATRVTPSCEPSEVVFGDGLLLDVAAEVFDPSRARSTHKMLEAIKQCFLHPGTKIVEVGVGSGALLLSIGIAAAKEFKNVQLTGIDIDQRAVDCCRNNFEKAGVSVNLLRSDIFEETTELFDFIIFNPPTYHPSVSHNSQGLTTLWDITGRIKKRFVESLLMHMNKDNPYSKALLLYSTYADHDWMSDVDFSGLYHEKILVEKDKISEIGVLTISPVAVSQVL
jgi:Fe-S-cluster formation regulator IscX/YfhJ